MIENRATKEIYGSVDNMKVAVLGAGIQGVCIALELIRRGYSVDLFDKNEVALSQASLVNEGKIHLGFVYANEDGDRTAKKMLRGAIYFRQLLDRWCDLTDFEEHLSSKFIYGIHTESMLDNSQIKKHFEKLHGLYKNLKKETGLKYLGLDDQEFYAEFYPEETKRLFSGDKIQASYKTIERAIDPAWLATRLRESILKENRLNWQSETTIKSITKKTDGNISVDFEKENSRRSSIYSKVVNCLWDGRIEMDESFGVKQTRKWLYRYKLAIRLNLNQENIKIPSTTMLLGPFGDIVNFQNKQIYLSWYPECMIGMSKEVRVPEFEANLKDGDLERIFNKSLEELSFISNDLKEISLEDIGSKEVAGGVIFAWGVSDIDEKDSELHNRSEIGLNVYDNYYSVDTGKYCMAPYQAIEVCDHICGV